MARRAPGRDLAAAEPARLTQIRADWLAWAATMPQPTWGSLNRTDRATPGELKALVSGYIQGLPVEPRSLLYGGGPE